MAAAKRAEIERRLAELQLQREREEELLRALSEDDTRDSAVSAADIRKKASTTTSSDVLSIFGQSVQVGDCVKTTCDHQLLRKCDATLPRRDPSKSMYLGEPGKVVALFASFHGRAAMELEFADRTRHIFFAECVVVGDTAERLTAGKELKSAPGSKKEMPAPSPGSTGDGHESTRRIVTESTVAPVPSTLPASLPPRPKVVPKANAGPSTFLAELELLADANSDVSVAPITPGPGRRGLAQRPVHTDPTSCSKVSTAGTKRPQPATSVAARRPTSSLATKPANSATQPRPHAPPRVATVTTKSNAAPSNQSAASATSRPVTLKVYENGSYGDLVNDRVPFRTVTVRPNFKSLGPVLSLVGQTLQWATQGRKVETLFDAATGRAISSVAELTAGNPVVASMGDAFVVPRPNSQLFSELPESAKASITEKTRARSPRVAVRTRPQPAPSPASGTSRAAAAIRKKP
eukprot:CAMPEP_0174853382 /NCGR_PEP_ID=MMETSP1114-20130205/28188_1 /TAXON_ID=312471 /ORGANISM="Neobodo designis, Strain CCAP 1951/1" /LENGTH=463 /DNA_ID=CAMNT_0016088023 /DNA_START=25 /DNA_END=1412 /DNA_ORIENTATION=+